MDTFYNLALIKEILDDLMILQAGKPAVGDYSGFRIYNEAKRRVRERAAEAKRSRVRAEINKHLEDARKGETP